MLALRGDSWRADRTLITDSAALCAGLLTPHSDDRSVSRCIETCGRVSARSGDLRRARLRGRISDQGRQTVCLRTGAILGVRGHDTASPSGAPACPVTDQRKSRRRGLAREAFARGPAGRSFARAISGRPFRPLSRSALEAPVKRLDHFPSRVPPSRPKRPRRLDDGRGLRGSGHRCA